MKTKITFIVGFFIVIVSASADTTISATVENVYTNAILLNWTAKRPIYGELPHSDSLISEGNFLGGVPISRQRPIVGYETIFRKEILLVNYPTDGVAEGQTLNFQANEIGTTNFIGKTIELWDAGIVPKTPAQIEEMKQEESKEEAADWELVENQRIADQAAAEAKIYAAQARAVMWLQSQATNGSASAQCSLGEHYLNGQGCQTNREQGIYWLQQAAEQGNIEASNKLANLQK